MAGFCCEKEWLGLHSVEWSAGWVGVLLGFLMISDSVNQEGASALGQWREVAFENLFLRFWDQGQGEWKRLGLAGDK